MQDFFNQKKKKIPHSSKSQINSILWLWNLVWYGHHYRKQLHLKNAIVLFEHFQGKPKCLIG